MHNKTDLNVENCKVKIKLKGEEKKE